MYQVTLTYGNHSGYIGNGGATLETAQQHLNEMVDYYRALAYPIHEAYISELCTDCSGGRVKRCKAPRRHADGYHVDRCYPVCKTCKGRYEVRVFNCVP